MLAGGRIAAAIDILADIETRKRPAAEALKDWGTSHRFAGSGDRAAIGNLVFDALRRRRSLAWRMGADSPRAAVLGAVVFSWGMDCERLETAFAGDRFAPEQLTDRERIAFRTGTLEDAPGHVRADVPEWLWPQFEEAFADPVGEGEALSARAPLDLRANRLKTDRPRVLKALARFEAAAAPHSPDGVRIAAPQGAARLPNIQSEPGYRKGWFEVQDEGSQLAALLSGAAPGEQVADICAGAGGKALALSAMMENKGQVHAYDTDRHRLAPIFERIKRAGTRNVQVISPGKGDVLAPLEGRMDLVFVDAPCTGTGVWRRRPDAKWRLSEEQLATRIAEQDAVLDQAARLVRPGGRIAYVTCSMLADENAARVSAFLSRHSGFAPRPFGDHLPQTLTRFSSRDSSLQLTPLCDSTDGFFIASLERSS